MLDGAIVPDGNVARRLPADARLDVVVLGDEVFDQGDESIAFVRRDALEAKAVHAAREDGVPARHRVGADGGVNGVEGEADVGGGAPGAVVGAFGAAGLRVVRVAPLDLEVLEEILEGFAQAVVEIVGAGVEGVAACGGHLAEAQGGIVAGVLFEGHVAVPFVSGGLAFRLVGLVAVALGDALGDEGDDFGVVAVEWVEGVCHDVVLGGAAGSSGDAVDDFLVCLVVEVLIAEYGNTTLGNCDIIVVRGSADTFLDNDLLVMARSRNSASALGDLRASTKSRSENSEPIPGVKYFCLKTSITPAFVSGPCQT